jgi:hypothetical protein
MEKPAESFLGGARGLVYATAFHNFRKELEWLERCRLIQPILKKTRPVRTLPVTLSE